jgi:hypothetical protein
MPQGTRRKPYHPPQDSLAWRLMAYLQANPGEELTRGDVAAKFDVDVAAVDGLLAPAEKADALCRHLSNENGVVWRLGAKAPFPRAVVPSLIAARRALRKRQAVVIDFSSLVIEPGVTMPQPSFGRGRKSEWKAFLSQLAVGDMVRFERRVRDAVAHAQSAYRKTAPGVLFAIRILDDTHVGLWRVE